MEEKKKPENLDSFAWSAIEQAKHQTKLWFIVFVITFAGLIGTNLAWLYAWQSYEYVSQDGKGINNINSGSQGDVTNGTESENQEER